MVAVRVIDNHFDLLNTGSLIHVDIDNAITGSGFLLTSAATNLSTARVFTAGTGIRITDGGAGGNYTTAINNSIVATLSGSTFSGNIGMPIGFFIGAGSHGKLGTGSIAIGSGAIANGADSIAIGKLAKAYKLNAIAIGNESYARGQNSIVIGTSLTGSNIAVLAIGVSSSVNNTGSLGIGNFLTSTGSGSIAIGSFSNVTVAESMVIGRRARILASGSLAIGMDAFCASGSSVAIGTKAEAQGLSHTIIGHNAAGNPNVGSIVAIGNRARVTFADGVAIGSQAKNAGNGVAIGSQAKAVGSSIAIGRQAGSTNANQLTFGSIGTPITSVFFTNITGSSPQNVTISGQGGEGFDIVGANLTIRGGLSTGNADGGYIFLQTVSGSGASASTLNSAQNRAVVSGSGRIQIYQDLYVVKNTDVSGTLKANTVTANQLTGSLTQLVDGTAYLLAGSGIHLATGSNGAITITSSGSSGGSSVFDNDATYVVMSTTSSLNNERVLTPGLGLRLTDGGANGNATLAINDSVVATLSGSTFFGNIGMPVGFFLGAGVHGTLGTSSIAIGSGTIANGSDSLSIGKLAKAYKTNAISIGSFAYAKGRDAIAIGMSNTGSNIEAIVLGSNAQATNTGSLAIGNYTISTASGSIAIGGHANITVAESMTIGRRSRVLVSGSLSVGMDALSTSGSSTVIGTGAEGLGANSTILGHRAKTTANSGGNIAIGTNATVAAADDGIAIGTSARQNSRGIAIGSSAKSNGSSIAIGRSAKTTASNQLMFGSAATPIAQVYFNGVTGSAPQNVSISPQSGEGTNINGANLTIQAGRHTGNADGGYLVFQTSSGSGGATTLLGTLATRMTISGSGRIQMQEDLYVRRNMDISGTLTKFAGTFQIPHPNPAKKGKFLLRHSFVESPTEGDNIYRFETESLYDNDVVQIQIPDYFKWLNKNPQLWVSPKEHFGRAYAKLSDDKNFILLFCKDRGQYNILLIGTRKDPGAEDVWRDGGGIEPNLG